MYYALYICIIYIFIYYMIIFIVNVLLQWTLQHAPPTPGRCAHEAPPTPRLLETDVPCQLRIE